MDLLDLAGVEPDADYAASFDRLLALQTSPRGSFALLDEACLMAAVGDHGASFHASARAACQRPHDPSVLLAHAQACLRLALRRAGVLPGRDGAAWASCQDLLLRAHRFAARAVREEPARAKARRLVSALEELLEGVPEALVGQRLASALHAGRTPR